MSPRAAVWALLAALALAYLVAILALGALRCGCPAP